MAKEGAAFERAQAAHCSWLPHQQYFCMICDRPDALARNEQELFHREDGAAISFRDGWGIYSWRGVVVPRDVIMEPDTVTVQRIRAETNVEQARCMIERRGWHWFLQETHAKVLDQRINEVEGMTKEVLLEASDDYGRFLVVCCPSSVSKEAARIYTRPVPATTRTCVEAQDYLSSGGASRIIASS